jgi:hypothetical protein
MRPDTRVAILRGGGENGGDYGAIGFWLLANGFWLSAMSKRASRQADKNEVLKSQ